ncbi:unnamed protein product, partial [Amoebophrya sp. A25]
RRGGRGWNPCRNLCSCICKWRCCIFCFIVPVLLLITSSILYCLDFWTVEGVWRKVTFTPDGEHPPMAGTCGWCDTDLAMEAVHGLLQEACGIIEIRQWKHPDELVEDTAQLAPPRLVNSAMRGWKRYSRINVRQ